jgi:hypothetical protein
LSTICPAACLPGNLPARNLPGGLPARRPAPARDPGRYARDPGRYARDLGRYALDPGRYAKIVPIIVVIFAKSFFIAKILCTYTMNYLR